MLLAYVDESFKGDFFGFGCVVASPLAVRDLTAALSRIIRQASVDYGIPASSEIHGYPMFHGKDDWSGVGARARVQVFRDVLQAIVAADVKIILRSVDSKRLSERQARENYPANFPPEQVCFQHVMQRINDLATRENEFALIIADEMRDSNRHRDRFATYQTKGTPGAYMQTALERLIDTIHFAPSHHSRMLQAADIMAFLYRRRMTIPTEPDARSEVVMAQMWQDIYDSKKLIVLGSWP